MKLYVNHLGQWVGNQDEARANGHPFEQVEVPYDKKGLLEFLNEHKVAALLDSSTRMAPALETAPERGNWSASATRYDIHDAAQRAPLRDLMVALAVYMNRIDEELCK